MKRQAGKDFLCRGNTEAPQGGVARKGRQEEGVVFFFFFLICYSAKVKKRNEFFFSPWDHRVRHDRVTFTFSRTKKMKRTVSRPEHS